MAFPCRVHSLGGVCLCARARLCELLCVCVACVRVCAPVIVFMWVWCACVACASLRVCLYVFFRSSTAFALCYGVTSLCYVERALCWLFYVLLFATL